MALKGTHDNLNGSETMMALTKDTSQSTLIYDWMSDIFCIFLKKIRAMQNDILLVLFLENMTKFCIEQKVKFTIQKDVNFHLILDQLAFFLTSL